MTKQTRTGTAGRGKCRPEGRIRMGIREASLREGGLREASVRKALVPKAGVLKAAVPEGAALKGTAPEAAALRGAVPEAAVAEGGALRVAVPEVAAPAAPVPEAAVPKAGSEDRDGGWTFVETLLVIAIVLILTGAVGFVGFRTLESARVAQARNQIATFRTALETYVMHIGRYPTEAQGLGALWEAPVIEPVPADWNGPYLSQAVPDDPWGNAYEYRQPGPDGLPYGIRSFGPGGAGSEPITSWSHE